MADLTPARTYGRHEPVAIVGIGCRLPARIEDPTALWQALLDGVDAVRQVPADRWNAPAWAAAETSGGAANRRGGFLDDVTRFDAEHFSIPPAEARQMDPQQRIALEVACAAVEDARRSTASLAGSRTGVFMGAMWQEYPLFTQGATEAIHAHSAIGWDNSVIPSRIAYALGLRGPAMGVATASSSSLVAVHLAMQSLRSGESDFALAGGVNLMLHPNTSVALTKLGTQSPAGLSRAFDGDGDGYARGEGCAVVVLRRLSDALADGDRVYALVHGSAVNNDGATDGLTAPGREAQTEVLRSAWENAGVAPRAVSYVEAHGTGTPLGDVTEAGALGTVFGPDRPAPLRIGSAKTNFGHLEPAAGVLGLVKAALAVHHGVIPPSLHFRTPNPRIDFSAERLEVVTEAAAWPAGPRFAGVSSFGYGGTNAHIALGEAPEGTPVRATTPDAGGPVCLAVSGTDSHALARNAARLADHLGRSSATRLSDVAHSLATTRTHHPKRGVVIAGTTDEAVAGLRALAADESHDAVVTGAAAERGRVAFVFPGQGAQWWGMGRALWEQNDAFREAVMACDEALAPHTGFSVATVVRGQDGIAPPFTRTDVVQPALFAMYVGLAAMWRAWGVEPEAVVGHSQGEVAAAVVSGALSLADGARIVALRARAVRDHAPDGAMGLVERPVGDVTEELAAYGDALSVAVVNTARSTVVAGDAEALDRFLGRMEATGAYCQRVDVDYASHSPHMDALLPALREQLTGLAPVDPGIAFYSSVTGERAAGPELDADYWCRNLREPVRFDRALERLRADGFGTFVEVSPHPVLQIALAQGTEADGAAVVVGSLRRDRGGIEQPLRALAELHTQGVPIPWKRVFPASDGRRTDLPTYAFEHRRYWLDEHDDAIPAAGSASWREAVMALPEPERPGSLVALVTEEAAALLGRPAEGMRPDLTLREQGFDSLMVVELRNRLSARTRIPLPTVLAFDYPTPQAIATLLLTHADSQDPRDRAPDVSPAVAAESVRPDDDPVVIVSMACRLPDGIDTPEAFWDLLADGREASSPFPQRWDGWDLDTIEEAERAATGRRFERRGGFVRDVEDFDAAFFGLSPREALSLDPQQRLVLEVVWEAIERANLRTASLEGSNTGVYIGAMSSDYDIARRWDAGSSDGYKITGNGSSLISGRVSYTLGLSGPALTIDTACSSSLVALRLACEALRNGECDLALAGGVTVMSTPQIFVEFSRLNGLAADGRCKSFADDADGTSWAEGCGVLVLKRLSDARRDGDRVLAVVRGTAMNQDGRSQGLTAPNGLAQQRVVRSALTDGGLTPADIDAVEAHATGTVLGDPIEAGALAAVFSGRVRPLHLGSAKSNIGHAQAASGVIGVIKMVLALQHELLPRTLHAEKPNTRIDWTGGELELLRQPRKWPRTRRVRRAGISSFGISGTNTHVIIEEAPQIEEAPETVVADRTGGGLVHPLVISGTNAAALRAQARHWAEWLDARPAAVMRDIAYTSAVGRTHFEARAVVFAGSATAAAEALRAVEPGSGTAVGEIAFVFGGQGGQLPGTDRQLLEQSAVFRDTAAECDAALSPLTGWSVLKVLRGEEDVSGPAVLSCMLFATYLGRAALWRSWGVEPAAVVVGDVDGEVAAAVVSGALSVEDGARVIALRARARSGDAVGDAMAGIVPGRTSLPVYSGRTGEVVPGPELGGDSWLRDLQEPEPDPELESESLRFDRALERLRGEGFGAFVEVGPPFEGGPGGVDQLRRAAATLFERGFPLEWERVLGSHGTGKADVPTYAFQRQRFWLGELPSGPVTVTAGQSDAGHAWFDAATTLAGSGGHLFTGRLSLDDGPWMADHVVGGQVYVPGAGLIDAALFAARAAGADAVTDLTLLEPVILLPGRALRIQATVGDPDAHGRRPFAFHSQPQDTDEPLIWQQHVIGECVTRAGADASVPPDLGDWPVPDARALDIEAFYGRALANGLDYGPAFRGLRELACRDGVHYARVSLPSALDEAGHGLHPALLDAALQVVVAGLMEAGAAPGPLVPFIWSDVELFRGAGRELTVRVSFASGGGEDLAPATVWLADPAGHPVARIGGLKFQPGRRRGHPFAEHLYRVGFEPVHPEAETLDPAGTLVVGDAEVGAGLGADVVPGLDALVKRLDGRADTPRRLLFALPDSASAQFYDDAEQSAAEALRTLQVCFGDARLQGAELVWITRDAVAASPDDQVGNWAHAAVWGMVRTARTEQPERVLRLIDLDPGTPDLRLLARVIESGGEPECALRGGTVHVPRARPTVEEVDALVLPDRGGWHLRQREDGQLDAIAAPHDESAPEPVAPGEVRVEVRAAGLSPEQALILEFAGTVMEVGSGVTSVHAGDRVMGRAPGVLGKEIRVDGATLRPMPAHLTFAQAAADPSGPDPRQDKGSFTAFDVRDAPYALRHAQQNAAHKAVLTLPRALDPAGTVLITGGLGELGSALAVHLVRAHGARRLVLLSRRGGNAPEAGSFVRELEAAGAERVDLVAGDVADRAAVAAVLEGIDPGHPLTAVFHLAGVLDDGLVEGFTAERLHRVMAPKVQGARLLDELTERLDLAAFVLFSSAAGTLGTAGQSGYAAANATLDALAANRRKRGLAGLSLAFGLWEQAGVGMTAHLGKAELGRLRRQGIGALTLAEGLNALDVALARPETQLMPVRLELASLRHALGDAEAPPLLRAVLRRTTEGRAAEVSGTAQSLDTRMADATEAERPALLLDLVRSEVADVLGLPGPDSVPADRALRSLGIDSLTMVQLRKRLAKRLNTTLPATLVFDYPTADAIAGLLLHDATTLRRNEK